MSVKRVIATVGLTAVETAVVKATFEDEQAPKRKHIKTICDYVELELAGTGYDTSTNKNLMLTEMFGKRVNRMTNNSLSWKVAIKSLITIHILFRECGPSLIEEFGQYGKERVFILTNKYVDNTSSTSIVQSTFIRKYSQYLLEKQNVYKQLNFNVERKLVQNNKDFFSKFDLNTLGKVLPKIMKQLSCLIEVDPQIDGSTFMVHALTKEAMLLLIKDSLRIYSSIQLILWQLLCAFQKLDIQQAKWTSNTYQQYFALNCAYQPWFSKVVKLGIVNHQYAPKFNTLPESLAHKLKKYIGQLQQEAIKKKKKRKRKKKAKDANLEDIVDEKYKQSKESESKESDLLGFASLFISSTDNPNQKANINNTSDDLLLSLNIKTPEAVNDDQFAWSNWGTLGDNNNNNNNNNIDHNANNNNLDDWWSSVPVPNANDANNNNNFGSFVTDLSGTNMNGTKNGSAISGGKARVLKKKNVNTNNDPFLDLLSFN